MADRQFYTNAAANAKALDIQTAMEGSKVRFFQFGEVTPTLFTTRAELAAAECDFSGYTPGGYDLEAWTGPSNNPGGGKALTSPLVNVAFDGTDLTPTTNSVGGWWIEDAATPTPQVRMVGVFDPPRNMAQAGDTIDWVDSIVEGKNPAPAV